MRKTRRNTILKEIVKTYSLPEGFRVYLVIPGRVIGDYSFVGITENGSINLTLNYRAQRVSPEKGFIRAAEGFLTRFTNKENPNLHVEIKNGSIYFIEGRPVIKDSPMYRLTNGQYYFTGNDNSPEYYFSKRISREIDALYNTIRKGSGGLKRLSDDASDLLEYLYYQDKERKIQSHTDKMMNQLKGEFKNLGSHKDTMVWINEDRFDHTGNIFDSGLYFAYPRDKREIYDAITNLLFDGIDPYIDIEIGDKLHHVNY